MKDSVKARSDFTNSQNTKMLLSEATWIVHCFYRYVSGVNHKFFVLMCFLSLCVCVSSFIFIELVEYIFTITGVTLFLSNQICQASLENF